MRASRFGVSVFGSENHQATAPLQNACTVKVNTLLYVLDANFDLWVLKAQ